MDTTDAATPQEEAVRQELLEARPDWTAELDYARKWVVRDQYGALLGRHMDIAMAAKIAEQAEGPGFPANSGLGHYTTSELNKAEASARAQLADDPEPADRERLERRLEEIAAERESRRKRPASMGAGWAGPSSDKLHDDRRREHTER